MEKNQWEKEISGKINNGEISVFNEVIDRFSPIILNYIFKIINHRETAEELTQEVFLKLWINRKKYEPKTKLVTFLYRIAYTTTIDYIRKNRKHLSTYQLDDINVNNPDISGADDNDDPELGARLKAEIARLPEKQKQAIILRTYEDKNYDEIARIMSRSVSSVESLLFRARRNLKKSIAESS